MNCTVEMWIMAFAGMVIGALWDIVITKSIVRRNGSFPCPGGRIVGHFEKRVSVFEKENQ